MNKKALVAERLRANLLDLSRQIARKPAAFDTRWARTISESFTLYTRTSTVNLFLSVGNGLAEASWPFPAFIDLDKELADIDEDFGQIPALRRLTGRQSLSWSLVRIGMSGVDDMTQRQMIDALLCRRFKKASARVFEYWHNHSLLRSRRRLLQDVITAYRQRLWGVCIPGLFPILDFTMRHCLQTDDLRVSVGTVAEAFKKAGISAESLKPGSGIWNARKTGVDPVFDDVGRDLRLPGLYLASFVDFAQKFYAWHSAASGRPVTPNRHAAVHGVVEDWSEADTVKVLMFLDLTIKLEPVLDIVLATEKGRTG